MAIKRLLMPEIKTTPVSDKNVLEIYLDGTDDFLIPLVFPDYKIHVLDSETISFFGIKFSTPEIKASYLGHAGVLLINGKTGLTKYYEYGRYYNTEPPGFVRKGNISDVKIKSGMISEKSLKNTLKEISFEHGQSGSISGVIIRGQLFIQANQWLINIQKNNSNKSRKPYGLDEHNCMTFVIDLVDSLGLDSSWRPPVVIPTAYIEQFQLQQVDLEYNFDTDTLEVKD